MTRILVSKWFGSFLLDDGEVVQERLAPRAPKELAKRLGAMSRGDILADERELVAGIEGFSVAEERLLPLGGELAGAPELRPDEFGFDEGTLQAATLVLARQRTRESLTADMHVIQAVNCIDDLTATANLLSERLHEWYGLHYPELTGEVEEMKYLKLVAEHGGRAGIFSELGERESLGMEVGEKDQEAYGKLASSLLDVHKLKGGMEKYVEGKMSEVAPNLAKVVGPIVGARLIAFAGGLKRLAKFPSSTVQVLGAEKALFHHLKEGGKPPKHGVIFQHPLIHQSPYWQRGKIARAFAGKASIAAKVDAVGGEFVGDALAAELEKRVEVIRKQHPNPPKKEKPSGKWRGKKRGR